MGTTHELAGKRAPRELLVDVSRLIAAYHERIPDPDDPAQRVAFGTSGHRGSSLRSTFNDAHIAAISQAICDRRAGFGASGPLFIGRDTHALSEPAFTTAVEVFAANGVELCIDSELGYTPTPAVSHAILTWNDGRASALADGVVLTPSHNPPEDGGYKYNPTSGGPADSETTSALEDRANELLAAGLRDVRRVPWERAVALATTRRYDFTGRYVAELGEAIDMDAVREAGLRIGADPMGGSGVGYWAPIADRYGLDIEVVNTVVDPTFAFMHVDGDGRIRMDCSSPHAMAGLIELRHRFDIAFGNDPDFDRHGIVTPGAGLMNPNHFLSVAVWYLSAHRPGWTDAAAIGKTLVSSAMIDRVAEAAGRRVVETPVGFKWFVDGLLTGDLAFAGEESAGAAFLRRNGRVWTTDKDGILLDLLAAEIRARTGRDPAEHYHALEERFGRAVYRRLDAPATPSQKAILAGLDPDLVTADTLAGEPILDRITRAPGNGEPIGGLKVTTRSGWFAARPSGTEDVYKIYAESFSGDEHLERLLDEARALVRAAFESAHSEG